MSTPDGHGHGTFQEAAEAVLEHELDSRECWCLPEVLQPCPECDEPPTPDCWRCAGRGLVEAFDDDEACVIVHRER